MLYQAVLDYLAEPGDGWDDWAIELGLESVSEEEMQRIRAGEPSQ